MPSIVIASVSVNGEETAPIRNWKLSVAVTPLGIVTDWPSVALSGIAIPPNHAQLSPSNGAAVPPPVPQRAVLHNGVPKLTEVWVVQAGQIGRASCRERGQSLSVCG